MRLLFHLVLMMLLRSTAIAQSHGFPFGKITYQELDMKVYPDDSSASAVVLNEFGEAYITITGDEGTQLSYEYHTKIKILTPVGLNKADFVVPLYKATKTEELADLKASTNVISGSSYKEIPFDTKKVMREKLNDHWDLAKFTLPGVTVGSVVEVMYKIEGPFIYNFHKWEFQSDIPKVYSEFWALIPGNYVYNTTLRGYLKLFKNESTIVKRCVVMGNANADCVLNKYAMKRIPTFPDEEYLSSPKNFMSAINYELSEIRHFGGQVDKITREWKDVEEELRLDDRFGGQLRKGKNMFDNQLSGLTSISIGHEEKAKLIYAYIKSKISWNGRFGFLPQEGIRKAFEGGNGNVGDVNLGLIAALGEAGLDSSPILLSTRDNGTPIMLHPVISDFNYVVAHVRIGERTYLLDATDPLLPFGMLPYRCLNGKGRLITREAGSWIDLQARSKDRRIISAELVMENNRISGTMEISHSDFAAYNQRKAIMKHASLDDYLRSQEAEWKVVKIKGYDVQGLDSLDRELVEKFNIEFTESGPGGTEILYIDPFFVSKMASNPLRSETRNYPVDLGTSIERTFTLNLEYPVEMEVDELPQRKGLTLPRNGGRYLLNVSDLGGTVSLTSIFLLSRPTYPIEEYLSLRELFANVVQSNQSVLVLRKKQ